jgi:hypothetical protein
MTYDQLRAAVATEPARPLTQPGKIYYYGTKILINEFNKGIHIIDNADPNNPKNLAFINIPGNVDLAVRANVLYADSYIDLVAIDISDPTSAVEVGRSEDVFPYRIYNNGFAGDPALGVIVDWAEEVVTEIDNCQNICYGWCATGDVLMFSADGGGTAQSGGPEAQGFGAEGGSRETLGMGGSMARFTLVDAYLYAIDEEMMHVFSIADLHNPTPTNELSVGWGIETIWSHGLHLFIGSQAGMHIYDITTPGSPTFVSTYEHINSCDPVVVSGNYAYVTLRSGTRCEGFTNQLDVVNISNMNNPFLVKSFDMHNPHGLGVDGELLFICDGGEGLKIFDKSDILNVTDNVVTTYPTINAFDVIPYGNVAMVISTDGFYQYDYSDVHNIRLMSVIPVEGV